MATGKWFMPYTVYLSDTFNRHYYFVLLADKPFFVGSSFEDTFHKVMFIRGSRSNNVGAWQYKGRDITYGDIMEIDMSFCVYSVPHQCEFSEAIKFARFLTL
jgi:hypothetical protein